MANTKQCAELSDDVITKEIKDDAIVAEIEGDVA